MTVAAQGYRLDMFQFYLRSSSRSQGEESNCTCTQKKVSKKELISVQVLRLMRGPNSCGDFYGALPIVLQTTDGNIGCFACIVANK